MLTDISPVLEMSKFVPITFPSTKSDFNSDLNASLYIRVSTELDLHSFTIENFSNLCSRGHYFHMIP